MSWEVRYPYSEDRSARSATAGSVPMRPTARGRPQGGVGLRRRVPEGSYGVAPAAWRALPAADRARRSLEGRPGDGEVVAVCEDGNLRVVAVVGSDAHGRVPG